MAKTKAANENEKLREEGIVINICLTIFLFFLKKSNFETKAGTLRDQFKT